MGGLLTFRTLILRALLLLALASCGLVQAADAPSREQALHALADPQAVMRRAAAVRLAEVGHMGDTEALLPLLKDSDGDVREAGELALWAVWSRSGDAGVDALLAQGTLAMNAGEFGEALEAFNRVVKQKPGFAEGWNKRATLYFLVGQTDKSLADCAEVLKRNPRHFGALSGYGQLYLRRGEPEKALGFFERAYAINPGMAGVSTNIEGLRRLLEQKRRRMI